MAESTNTIQKEIQDREAKEKRELRRKRRRRNQILAILTLLLFVCLIVAIIGTGVWYIMHRGAGKTAGGGAATTEETTIDNLFESEDEIVKPEETNTEPALTPEQQLDAILDEAFISQMPLEDKVAGLFIVTPESITGVNKAVKAGDGTKDALNKYAVGGIVYASQNMQDAAQFTEMVSNTTLYSRYALFTCVAEEGGSSTSLEKAGLADKTDSEQAMGTGADAAKAYEASGKIADSMLTYGLNLNFAPVADLATVQDSYLKDASYGSDAALAASFVTFAVQGMQEKGISSCLKYFPGAADMKEDPAKGMATSERTAEQLAAEEFTVFKAGIDAGADMVMVGHVAVPALTGDNTPCSLSSAVITDKLRNELGFNGVIITDAMNKGAITEYYETDEAAILALKAGCDMILCPDDFEKAYNGVLEAVQNGTISEERINDSLRRIYRIKYAGMMPEA
ncbi:beta-glucosidase-related glycosidase [Clostridium sp. CAG:510]|nr:beta-glucosidase-related glycosidase [Clostridium sp. CAG:510]